MDLELISGCSLLCLVIASEIAAVELLLGKRKKALYMMTGGVFAALLILFLVRNRGIEDLGAGYRFLFAAYDALKAFSLGHEAKVVLELTAKQTTRDYAAFLLVLAPALTLSNVLTLFSNLLDSIRYRVYRGKNQFILSELRAESLALAASIRKEHYDAQIVFTGVGKDCALQEQARELHAVCLRQGVAQLELRGSLKGKRVFFISRDESQNVSDAVTLIERYKDKQYMVEMYVYASAPEFKIAIDMVDKGENVLNPSFRTYLDENLKPVLEQADGWDKNRILNIAAAAPLESSFSVRCVDMAELTVRSILKDNFDAIRKKAKESNRTVSITVLGFGKHGSTMLKTAAWMFQLYGYRLQINVFDKDGTARRRLQQEAPELLGDPGSCHEGDASHDILFMGGDQGNDCFSSDFDLLFRKYWSRLEKTHLVFVSMGDDSRNIAAAMHFREQFLRMQIETVMDQTKPEDKKEMAKRLKEQYKTVCTDEVPLICAMVTDPVRSANLKAASKASEEERSLMEYNITPVGMLTAAYDFKHIQELMKLEKLALRCHLLWCAKDIISKKKKADAGDLDENKKPVEMDSELALKELVKQTQLYVRNSYYRDSSVAMAVHQVHMIKLKTEFPENERTKNCMITEHMRWNAYMRSQGYRQHEVRCDRAKFHPLIVPYYDLSEENQAKDLVEFSKEEIKCIFPDPLTPKT